VGPVLSTREQEGQYIEGGGKALFMEETCPRVYIPAVYPQWGLLK
jgi:hypothetical protein